MRVIAHALAFANAHRKPQPKPVAEPVAVTQRDPRTDDLAVTIQRAQGAMTMGTPVKMEWVKWLDTGLAISDGWMTPEHILAHAQNQTVESVGFVMHEDTDIIVLTGSYAPDIDQHLNAQVIRKSAIIAREAL
jgi:hypothetical protein